MKISIIGFMGSGKTTVAQALAKEKGFTLHEMDAQVFEKTLCKDMTEVFAKGGEILLREWEIQLAKEWKAAANVVISTGGGVVLNKIIIDYLKEQDGKVVFLNTPFQEIATRVEQDASPRPLFQNIIQAEALFQFRLPLYTKYADIIIETHGKILPDIVTEISSKL